MSEHIVRLGSQRNQNVAISGTVAPRKFIQLTDVNMIGVKDGDLVGYAASTKTFVPAVLAKVFPDEVNLIYVSKNGNDTNSGRSIQEAKLTLDAAVGIASEGTVIRISPGNYTLNNPVTLPDQVSLVASSLREVSISGQNPDDLFYVGNGNYIAEMSFVGNLKRGAAIVSFDPNAVRYINQSPYVQNCTNFIPESIGMRIDGKCAIGPIKSMVLDSYTQYNQAGIGISITNSGYAQLVSLFTICNDIAVYCGSGGACDLTNSNSSFGNYALVADGVGPLQYVGIITNNNLTRNSDIFEVQIDQPQYSVTNANYDNTTGYLTVYTNVPHNFSVGMGVSISGLGFTCTSGPGILTYPSGKKGNIFNTITVGPGRYVDSYNSIQSSRREIQDKSLASIALNHPDFYFPGDTQTNSRSRYYDSYRLIQKNKTVIIDSAWNATAAVYPGISTTQTKCKRDLGYFVDAISTDIFTGGNKYAREFALQYFNNGVPISNGLIGEETQSVYAFNQVRDLMKAAVTNTLIGADYTDLTLTSDPITGSNVDPNSCADVRSNIDNLVSIVTTIIGSGDISFLPNENLGTFTEGESKCFRDIGYIIDAVSTDIRDYTSENSINAVRSYFDINGDPITNGLMGEETETITAFVAVRDYMKLAINNQLNYKNFSLVPDPITGSNNSPNSCSNVQSFIDNLVGIITSRIAAGNINGSNALPPVSKSSNVFTTYVGISTLQHTYYGGGTVSLNTPRPFDGQVLYFETLYYSVNKISIIDGGSGYSSPPLITIDPPLVPWGIPASAVAEIRNGRIINIELVSSGRGYTTPPKVTISSPISGITARAIIDMSPTYYSINSSTDISSGICTVTLNDNIPYEIQTGTKVYFYKQSRVLASGHSLEYIGSGTDITKALPALGGVPIQENETDSRNGGLVVYTSTDQSGNFRIGDGVVINQQAGTISGTSYSKSLFSTMTPYILALGGE